MAGLITLPSAIPTTACTASAGAFATFTSSVPLETGVGPAISADKFWNQAGAVWKFTVGDPSLGFHSPGLPGAGSGHSIYPNDDSIAQQALSMSPDNKTFTLSVPYPTLAGEWNIVFNVIDLHTASNGQWLATGNGSNISF